MSVDSEDEIIQYLMDEAAKALPGMVERILIPWVALTAAEVLECKVTSAGPTRGGGHVQVRYRVGPRTAASSHSLNVLRDANMEFAPPNTVSPFIRMGVTHAVVRPDKIEARFRASLRGHLEDSCKNIPPDVLERAKANANPKAGFGRAYQGEIHRLSHEFVNSLKVLSLVLSSPGVLPVMESIIVRAAELVVSVPYHKFPDSGRKLKHATAKRKLLKAMKAALVAGVTDQELEEIKNEALVFQIMS